MKLALVYRLSHNKKYKVTPVYQAKYRVLQGASKQISQVLHGIGDERCRFRGQENVSCTLAITENKIKQGLRDVVGPELNITELVERSSSQECPLENLISRQADLFDTVADIIEEQQRTQSDKQIQAIEDLLLCLPKLVYALREASNLPEESKLSEILYYSFNHLTNVLADTIEFRNITSEISETRANPVNDNKQLQRARGIISRGKKRAKKRKEI